MPDLKEKIERRNAIVSEAQELMTKLEGKTPDADQTEKLRSLDTEFKGLEGEIKQHNESGEIMDRFRSASELVEQEKVKAREEQRPPLYGTPENTQGKEFDDWMKTAVTPGEKFVRSEEYQGWLKKFPSGGPSIQTTTFSDKVQTGGYNQEILGLTDPSASLRGTLTPGKFRSLLTSQDTGSWPTTGGAGLLVQSLRRGLLDEALLRPLTVRDLVTTLQVSTDTIEYVIEKQRLQNAATVAEASAITGTTGTKPEGGLEFETKSDTVKTLAEWVPLTKRILADAPQLRAYIDQYLTYDLALELEDQIMSGGGTGEDFRGILNTANVLTQTGAANNFDDIRAAIRKVTITGRARPNAVVMTPADIETFETTQDGNDRYYSNGPFGSAGVQTLWGLRIVQSEALTDGTAVVGDFSRAILFNREDTQISVGTAGDDFIRNIVRVLAELRAGFGVIRPKAFCVVTL